MGENSEEKERTQRKKEKRDNDDVEWRRSIRRRRKRRINRTRSSGGLRRILRINGVDVDEETESYGAIYWSSVSERCYC